MKTNKWILALVIGAALSWTACDDDDDNGLDKPELNDTDETFVEVAARSNMAEIEFGELAVEKGTDPEVIEFAQQMIDEHTTAQEELKDIADDHEGVEWPNDLDEGHDEIMEQLNDAEEGYKFDSLYMSTQVTAHEATANTFRTATTNTTNARVKAYASKYLPAIEMHLEEAQTIRESVIATDDGTDDTTDGTDTEDGTGTGTGN